MSTLGRRVTDALSGPGTVQAAAGGLDATVEVAGAGPYGADVHRVRVDGEVDVEAVVDAIVRTVTWLPEALERFEVTAERGLLRTARERVRDREYYEVEVTPSGVEFGRFRQTEPGRREVVRANFGLRSLERLVDEIAGAISAGRVDMDGQM